jgi:hypothetical protein
MVCMAHVKREMNRARQASKIWQTGAHARAKGWVRKNVVLDQRKLDTARRLLRVTTEAEAIDVALGLVTFHREFVRGIAAVRRAGGIEDVFEKRQTLIANHGRVVS